MYINKNMKKIVQIISAAVCSVMLLAGCQATPTTEIVAGKNDGVLEEKLEATPATEGTNFNAPEMYTDSYSAYDGKVNVEINAKVGMATGGELPAVSLTKRDSFTEDEVQAILSALFGNSELTAEASEASKNDLEKHYIEIKKQYDDMKNGISDPNSEGGATLEDLEKMLADIEVQIASAPESTEEIKVTAGDYISGNNFLYAYGTATSGAQASIRIDGANIEFLVGDGYYCDSVLPMDSIDSIDGVSLTKSDAIAKAEDVVRAMGMSDMAASGIGIANKGGDEFAIQNASEKAYCICFMRSYKGNLTFPQNLNTSISDETYAEPMFAEVMQVVVNENGIAAVTINGACSVKEEVNSNVELTDFEQIVGRFKTQTSTTNAYFGDSEMNIAKGQHYAVSKIELGYVQIQQKNSKDTLLIPAWTFYGTNYIEFDEDAMKSQGTSDESIREIIKNQEVAKNTTVPLMTINAIDGSLISQ